LDTKEGSTHREVKPSLEYISAADTSAITTASPEVAVRREEKKEAFKIAE
jgi:hypothetical protein